MPQRKRIVVLDSSILRKDPSLQSTEMISLSQLCSTGKVELAIPEIAMNECITAWQAALETKVRSAANDFNRAESLGADDILAKKLLSVSSDLQIIQKKVKQSIIDNFNKFITAAKGRILKLSDHHAKIVFQKYFEGQPPFKSQKSREDIPDAFILESILDLVDKKHKIFLIAEDKGLAQGAHQSHKISVFNKLPKFLTSATTVENRLQKRAKTALDIFRQFVTNDKKSFMSELDDSLQALLTHRTITDSAFLDDNNEAHITGVYSADDIDLDESAIFLLNQSIAGIPFEVQTTVDCYYYILKADYYVSEEVLDRKIHISDHNDHYFEAEETVAIRVSGVYYFAPPNKSKLLGNYKNRFAPDIDIEVLLD